MLSVPFLQPGIGQVPYWLEKSCREGTTEVPGRHGNGTVVVQPEYMYPASADSHGIVDNRHMTQLIIFILNSAVMCDGIA